MFNVFLEKTYIILCIDWVVCNVLCYPDLQLSLGRTENSILMNICIAGLSKLKKD